MKLVSQIANTNQPLNAFWSLMKYRNIRRIQFSRVQLYETGEPLLTQTVSDTISGCVIVQYSGCCFDGVTNVSLFGNELGMFEKYCLIK